MNDYEHELPPFPTSADATPPDGISLIYGQDECPIHSSTTLTTTNKKRIRFANNTLNGSNNSSNNGRTSNGNGYGFHHFDSNDRIYSQDINL